MSRIFSYLLVSLVVSMSPASALISDRDQSVLVEADEVEMDFASGKRIYRGNVSVKQGTIRIIADQIELFYKGEQLDHGIATGNPAVFRQRPEGKDHDVVGTGKTIELDEINNIVTFITDAKLRQDRDAIEGDRIVYDMGRDKMIVRGGDATPTRTTRVGEDAATALPTQNDNGRPRMVLQPESDDTSGSSPASNNARSASSNGATDKIQSAFINATGAPVFAARTMAGASLGTLPAGTAVRVLRITDSWAEVNASRAVHVWIFGKFVSTQSGVGTVTGSAVRIRSAPSTASDVKVLGEVNAGDKVQVLETRGDWKKITAPSTVPVWIPASRLETATDSDSWNQAWRTQSEIGAAG